MKKRVSIGMIVFVLIMAILVSACSSGSQDASSTPQADTGGKAASGPVSFTILSNDGGQAYAKKAKPGDPFYKEMSKLFSDSIGQPTTINFDFIPSADYAQQMITRFASNDIPEIVSSTGLQDKGNAKAVENGQFVPLNDLIDKYGPNLKKKIPQSVWESPRISENGKIYGIPKMLNPMDPAAFFVRQDWLDKLNMKAPTTLQEYLDFFKAVKNTDLNGDGKKNEVGYVVRDAFGMSNAFFGAFHLDPSGGPGNSGEWQFVGGQFIPDIINPKMKDAVAFYKTLYDNGYMNRDFLQTKATQWTNYVYNGLTATWSSDIRQTVTSWSPARFAEKDKVKPGFLPGFKQDDGKILLKAKSLGVAKVFFVTKKMKDPARFVQFMNWCYSDDPKKDMFFDFGLEGQNHTNSNGKITFDSNSKVNVEQAAFFETMIDPASDARMDEAVLKAKGGADLNVLKKGVGIDNNNLWDDPALNMPLPKAMEGKPELSTGVGSLFLDYLTKAITGKVDVNKGFDTFVSQWEQRGGADAIKEATAWYKANHK